MTINVGVVLVLLSGSILFGHKVHISATEKAIAECEASLPRDQHCKVTAIPVIKEGL